MRILPFLVSLTEKGDYDNDHDIITLLQKFNTININSM